MKKLFVLIFLLSALNAISQNMIIKPDMPRNGELIRLIYDPSDLYKNLKDKNILLYTFSSGTNKPIINEIKLTFDSVLSVYTASFEMPQDAVFGLFQIVGFDDKGFIRFDDNSGNFWDISVYNSTNIKKENSAVKNAASWIGNLSGEINRNINYSKAIELLTEETKNYPDNMTAQIGLTSLLFDLKKISKDDFYSLMKKHLNSKPNLNDESTVRAVSRALNILNEKEKSKQIEVNYIKNNDNSELAEEYFLDKLAEVNNLKDFSDNTKDYLTKFPDSKNSEMVYNAIISGYLQSNKYSELMQYLANFERVPASFYCDIAIKLLQNSEYMPNTSDKVRIDSAKSLFERNFTNLSINSQLYSQTIQNYYNTIYKGNFALNWAIANAFFDLKYSSQYFEISYDFLRNRADYNFYKNYSKFLIGKSDKENALKMIAEAISNNQYDEEMAEDFFVLRSDIYNENIDLTNEIFKELLDKRDENIFNNLAYEEIEIPINDYLIKDLSNRAEEFKDLTKDITVVFFWSSWCGPCQAAFLTYQDISDFYKNSPNVSVVSLNIWDDWANPSELKSFTEDNELTFPIFFDDTGKTAEYFGINGLPVFVVMDSKLNVRFKFNGFTSGDELIPDIDNKVQYLSE